MSGSETEDTLRLTVLGQALIQHDLRADPWPDLSVLAAMFARADVCFTDLETAIRGPQAEVPTRQGVFLHAADPVVLDCLKELSIALVATATMPGTSAPAGSSARSPRSMRAALPMPEPASASLQPQRRPTGAPRTVRSRWWRWHQLPFATVPPRP